MSRRAIITWDGVICSIQDALIGAKMNRDNERIAYEHVRIVERAIHQALQQFTNIYQARIDSLKKSPSFVPFENLEDGEVHVVCDGIGKTYVQYLPDEKMFKVWRNDDPPEFVKSLPQITGRYFITNESEVRRNLKRTLLWLILREVTRMYEAAKGREGEE